MNAWWQGLSTRDRRTVLIGGVLALLLLVWSLAWEPLVKSRDEWRTRAAAAQASLRWMREASAVLQARGASPQVGIDGRSLLARVDAGAREAGLGNVLLRVEPVGTNEVRVLFEQAPFDPLAAWLEQLATTQGVQVVEFSATRADGVGLVDVRMSLQDGGR